MRLISKYHTILLVPMMIFWMGTTPMIAQKSRPIIGVKVQERQDDLSLKIKVLAQKITKDAYEDSNKSQAIFNWLVHHIAYDYELRFDKELQKRIYITERYVIKNVLDREKALCGGYAFLFEALCKAVGIEAVTVHGYSITAGKPISKQIDHTWNAVLIDGKWKLLDITYAVGYGGNGNAQMWYDCKPAYFIKSHYPQHPRWSLLKKIPAKEDAVKLLMGSLTNTK